MIEGRVFKYGDNIDTDVMIPARYLNIVDRAELTSHCMEDIDKEFIKKVKPGDVMAVGKNFGCGSSREHAPLVIKLAGISCIIAESFARIFYRNAVNIGLPILECPEAARDLADGDRVKIDLESGKITNITKGSYYQAESFPEFMQDIMNAGGLINYVGGKVGD